jgi:hypothetical protein
MTGLPHITYSGRALVDHNVSAQGNGTGGFEVMADFRYFPGFGEAGHGIY